MNFAAKVHLFVELTKLLGLYYSSIGKNRLIPYYFGKIDVTLQSSITEK